MEYKVLVRLIVPEIEKIFDVYIPVNKSVGQVMSILNKAVHSETNFVFPLKKSLRLINKKTFQVYEQSLLIRKTDIKNGTELILI